MGVEKGIRILERGNEWIGVDKPWGMSVHNDPGRDVVSVLREMIGSEKVPAPYIQPVHRLDRDTSGVLLLALTPEKAGALSLAFQQGRVRKHYLALVHGVFDPDSGPGVWDFPLSKEAGGRQNPGGRGKKLRAETRYSVKVQTAHYALLEISLVTGRKHQIRRHAKLAGHPVTGDRRYGSKRSLDFLSHTHGYTRLGLHAAGLQIKGAGPDIHLSAPDLPGQMEGLMDVDS